MHLPPPFSRQISCTEDEGRKFLLNIRVIPNFTALYSRTPCWAISVEFLVVSSVLLCCLLCPTGMFVYRSDVSQHEIIAFHDDIAEGIRNA